ncbi:MAG: hemolysin family protein [Saprospiraceae bacterium]|nr:hemolysin family protein [Saprospiraceae bacterium]
MLRYNSFNTMLLNILLTFFLVFLNGFFVAAEFAIVKVRLSQIQVKAGSSFSARVAESVVSNLDGYLAATQLGITLASLGLGWIGEGVVSEIIIASMNGLGLAVTDATAHAWALPISFVLITVLHIVFGELAPKSLAIRYPTRTTMALAPPLKLFYIVFRPFIWALNGFANFILKSIGIQPAGHSEIHSEEELKLIVAESAEGGAIEASERELIQNVFDFDDRMVRQSLKPRNQISALSINMPLPEAARKALDEGYSRYPVYEESMDKIIGFILTKDLLDILLHKPDKGMRDILRPMLFIPSNKKLAQVLQTFQKEHTQIAIVVNEFGGTVGILTLEDILEELVGEIQDEYDVELPIVEKITEQSFRIHAQNPVDEINDFLPVPFQEGKTYITLSGLILESSDAIPKEGETLTIGSYQIKILKMNQSSPEIIEVMLQNIV